MFYRAHPLGLSKNWTSGHRRTHKTIASLGNSWLEKIIKNGKLKKEGDNQRLAVVDVHFRLSLSEPKHVPDFVGRLVPRWISMLNGAQPWLPHPPQGTVSDLLCLWSLSCNMFKRKSSEAALNFRVFCFPVLWCWILKFLFQDVWRELTWSLCDYIHIEFLKFVA